MVPQHYATPNVAGTTTKVPLYTLPRLFLSFCLFVKESSCGNITMVQDAVTNLHRFVVEKVQVKDGCGMTSDYSYSYVVCSTEQSWVGTSTC